MAAPGSGPSRYKAHRTCRQPESLSFLRFPAPAHPPWPSPPRPAPETLGLMSSQPRPASPRGRLRPAPPSQAFLRQGIPAPALGAQWKPVTPAPAVAGFPAAAAGRGGACSRGPPRPTPAPGASVHAPRAHAPRASSAQAPAGIRTCAPGGGGAGVHKFTDAIARGRHRGPACGAPAGSREGMSVICPAWTHARTHAHARTHTGGCRWPVGVGPRR